MNIGGDSQQITVREAETGDLNALCALEYESFSNDRLNERRFKHWITARNRVFLVVIQGDELLAYGLVLLPRGTRLARLYSIAVSVGARGRGIGQMLVGKLEQAVSDRSRLYMRLEVAENNPAAIRLYRKLGYLTFGRHENYYEDHQPALRMQKRVRYVPKNLNHLDVPWYGQTTGFTCGPAAAMMAMAALSPGVTLKRELELDIWREATTIFMTSGHGGCHPIGLALAIRKRGLQTEVFLNTDKPLFLDSVRSPDKKDVVALVHRQFLHQGLKTGIAIQYQSVTQDQISQWINQGKLLIALISTYQMDRRKAPHWVTLTAADDECLYVHDPDPGDTEQGQLDCQYVPISRKNFDRMAQFGAKRLSAFVVVSV